MKIVKYNDYKINEGYNKITLRKHHNILSDNTVDIDDDSIKSILEHIKEYLDSGKIEYSIIPHNNKNRLPSYRFLSLYYNDDHKIGWLNTRSIYPGKAINFLIRKTRKETFLFSIFLRDNDKQHDQVGFDSYYECDDINSLIKILKQNINDN